MEKVSVEVSILKNKVVGRVTAIRLRGGVDGCGGSVGPGGGGDASRENNRANTEKVRDYGDPTDPRFGIDEISNWYIGTGTALGT